MLEKWFKLKENNTTAKTEVMAGITTFMTMAYILAVNPTMLAAAGMDKTAVLIATALASFIGTMAMALLANYPFALAPGMGLNAYFAYTVCGAMGYSWQNPRSAPGNSSESSLWQACKHFFPRTARTLRSKTDWQLREAGCSVASLPAQML